MPTAAALARDYLTLTQAAEEAGCVRQRIAQLIDSGKLPALTVAGQRFVHRKDAKAIELKRETQRV